MDGYHYPDVNLLTKTVCFFSQLVRSVPVQKSLFFLQYCDWIIMLADVPSRKNF